MTGNNIYQILGITVNERGNVESSTIITRLNLFAFCNMAAIIITLMPHLKFPVKLNQLDLDWPVKNRLGGRERPRVGALRETTWIPPEKILL